MRGGGTRGEERQDGKGKKEGERAKEKGRRKRERRRGEEGGRRKMIYIYNIVAKCTACD